MCQICKFKNLIPAPLSNVPLGKSWKICPRCKSIHDEHERIVHAVGGQIERDPRFYGKRLKRRVYKVNLNPRTNWQNTIKQSLRTTYNQKDYDNKYLAKFGISEEAEAQVKINKSYSMYPAKVTNVFRDLKEDQELKPSDIIDRLKE